MLKSILLAATISLFLAPLAGQSGSVPAQTPDATKPRLKTHKKRPPANRANAPEAPVTELTPEQKAINDINKTIGENCDTLIKTIRIADLTHAEFPFYKHQIYEEAKCKDGHFSWTATRITAPNQSLSNEHKKVTVTIDDATTLNEVAAQGSIVRLKSEGTITVLIDENETHELDWFLELRENKHAKSFASDLKELIANLKRRKDLETAKAKKESETAKAKKESEAAKAKAAQLSAGKGSQKPNSKED